MSENLPPVPVAGAEPPFIETSQPLTPDAGTIAPAINPRTGESFATEDWHTMTPVDRARHNERELEPLRATGKKPAEILPITGGVAEAVTAAAEGKLDPFYARQIAERERLARGEPVHPTPPQPTVRRVKRIAAMTRPAVLDVAELNDVTMEEVRRGEREDLQRAVALAPALARGPAGDGAPVNLSVGASAGPSLQALPPPAGPTPDQLAPIDLSFDPTRPAASDTDSPTRGIPRAHAIDATRKRERPPITGGFGDQSEMQYFALSGVELLALTESLMDDLHNRIQNDLRFSEALCYPRVAVKVSLEVTGFGEDRGFVIDKLYPGVQDLARQTPLDLARSIADEIVFVVVAERREVDEHGDSLEPPDAVRQSLGLKRPGKRMVTGPGGVQQWVDV
jgi:hypothetical protein